MRLLLSILFPDLAGKGFFHALPFFRIGVKDIEACHALFVPQISDTPDHDPGEQGHENSHSETESEHPGAVLISGHSQDKGHQIKPHQKYDRNNRSSPAQIPSGIIASIFCSLFCSFSRSLFCLPDRIVRRGSCVSSMISAAVFIY